MVIFNDIAAMLIEQMNGCLSDAIPDKTVMFSRTINTHTHPPPPPPLSYYLSLCLCPQTTPVMVVTSFPLPIFLPPFTTRYDKVTREDTKRGFDSTNGEEDRGRRREGEKPESITKKKLAAAICKSCNQSKNYIRIIL